MPLSVFVCFSVGNVDEPCKTAQPIEMPIGTLTWVSEGAVYEMAMVVRNAHSRSGEARCAH